MKRLILTRGIAASGKTTWAKSWVYSRRAWVRVNRDDLRFMMYGVYHGGPVDEQAVTKVQHAMITAAIEDGNSVVVDDTNLNERFVEILVTLGHRAGAAVSILDIPVTLEEALRRNARRDRKVPEHVIREMYDRFQNRKDIDVTPTNMSATLFP